MFSVDNFYDFFQSCYGFHKTGAIPWIFHPHGSKNIADAKAWHGPDIDNLELDWYNWSPEKKLSKTIIMHDQEPFYKDYCIDTYRKTMMSQEKGLMWGQMADEELFLAPWKSFSWPIFCHSEINSPDINWLRSIGVIDCYYFWHGLVVRDWFRHWKHSPDLKYQKPWRQRFLLYIRDCTGTREYRSEVKQKLSGLKNEIKHDWLGIKTITGDYSAKIVVEDAEDTAIHLVAETIFGSNKIHITEKMFKPMVMKQPFIVFAGPRTLEFLRNYGFQTFGEIWNESYDLITDPNKRMDAIISLINTLYQMPEPEFQSLIQRCQSIVEHNNRWFFSNEFEYIMLKELHNNVQQSIKKQQDLEATDPGGSFFHMLKTLRKHDIIDSVTIEITTMIDTLKSVDLPRYQKILEKCPWVKEIR